MSRPPLSHRLAGAGRGAWRAIAPTSLRRSAQPLVRRMLEQRIEAGLRPAEPSPQPGPLVVSGLLSETKGVSEGARLSIAAFRAAGLDPVAHDLRPLLNGGATVATAFPTQTPGGVWFVHVNAPEAIHALGRLPPASWRGRHRIGYWAYELPRAPAEWARASRALHEIWAPSEFVAAALRHAGVTTPVRTMPHPVALGPSVETPNRAAFGIPADTFAVLAMGDLHSSAARKNLIGAIEIYLRAFPQPGHARLIMKVRESGAHPAVHAAIRQAARGRSDIHFITNELSSDAMRLLIASVSVVLSPHRAEGFGLPLAEALLAGVPALATGWSGNLDYMSDLPELLIASSLAPVQDPQRIYRAPGQKWAEPDQQDAANKLRALAGSSELRARLAGPGRAAVEALSLPWRREALLAIPMGRLVAVRPVDGADPSR
jgi:glycosyltransferase involved in cell wall biosynthesis